MNILVLCTGNSARSILLESILNTEGAGRVTAYSAGSKPAGRVHPQSLRLLNAKGHDTNGFRSKSWDEFATDDAPKLDMVITVCGSAASEECPVWPAAPVRAHWGVEDPAAASEDNWEAAFTAAYDMLARRARTMLALDIESLDKPALKQELDRIGTL